MMVFRRGYILNVYIVIRKCLLDIKYYIYYWMINFIKFFNLVIVNV